MLSSDVLEEQFGPTKIEILYQDSSIRIIRTKSIHDDRVLEVSQVVFAPNAGKAFPGPYKAMRAGESMGKAFRSRGIEFGRRVNDSFAGRPPDDLKSWLGGINKVTVIRVSVLAGPQRIPFAEILETYCPEVDCSKLLSSFI